MTSPAPESTWALHTDNTLDEVNLHLAALTDAGLLGIVEQDGRATVYLRTRVAVPLRGTWEQVTPRDWNAAWKADIEPVVVGSVTIVAPWHDRHANGNDVVLVIEPAQAFGTGHHETTTLCLQALQSLQLGGRSVFDLGTGTGVLALAARALGAQPVLAADIDPLAVEAAAANAQINSQEIDVQLGSIEAAAGAEFDVVVANLDTDTLSRLADAVVRCVAPGGTFIGSGISNERSDEAVAALGSAGLAVTAQPGREWALLRGQVPAQR